MSEKIVQLNEEIIKGQLKELVRGSVEETLNELLEKEAESLTQAACVGGCAAGCFLAIQRCDQCESFHSAAASFPSFSKNAR